jgi:type I restriction enzyme M protein
LAKQQGREVGGNSWVVAISDIAAKGYDLSAKNPSREEDYEHRPVLELVQSIKTKEERILELLCEIESVLEQST